MNIKHKSPRIIENPPTLRKTSSISLATILKLPNLGKASSPHLGNKFFCSQEDLSINLKLDRKPNHSLSSHPLLKFSDDPLKKIEEKKRIAIDALKTEDLEEAKTENLSISKKNTESVHNDDITKEKIYDIDPNQIQIFKLNKEKVNIKEKINAKEKINTKEKEKINTKEKEKIIAKEKINQKEKEKIEATNEKKNLENLLSALNLVKGELNLANLELERKNTRCIELEKELELVNIKLINAENQLKSHEQTSHESDKFVKMNSLLKDQLEETRKKMQIE